MAGISGISGSGSFSVTGLENLFQQMMSLERQPLTRLQAQKDDLKVRKGIYEDIKTKLETVRSNVQALTGDSGSLNKFGLTFSNEDVADISVSSSTNVSAAQYTVTVNNLAEAHRLASVQQVDSVSALNLSGDLIINDQSISIEAGDSLSAIRNKINSVDYEGAGVEAVIATMVDNKLVLTSAKTGTDAAITYTDNTNGENGLGLSQIQPAENASLTVNGISITRQGNTDLDDIIDGLTYDLKEEGTTQVTAAKDNNDVVDKVKTLLESVNDLVNHLKLKTQPQLDATALGDNPTYKSAPLGNDLNLRSLRFNLASDLLSFYQGAVSGAPANLADIGIIIGDDNVSFELTDESALTAALDDDFEGVADLLDYALGKVENRVALYLDGTDALITGSENSLDDQIELLDNRIDSFEARLAKREEAIHKQLTEIQSQLITMQYQFQSTQAAMSGTISVLNQLG